MTRLLALLSGDVPGLAMSELKSILYVLTGVEEVEPLGQRLVKLDVDRDLAWSIVWRSAYVKEVVDLAIWGWGPGGLSGLVMDESPILSAAHSFAVRVAKIGGARYDKMGLERVLGGVIKSRYPRLKVSLESPSLVVRAYATGEGVYAGPLLAKQDYKTLNARRPKNRPFKHPSALVPRLARCMVNLARVRPGGRIIDPFAGTGSIPMEAADLGYRVVAIELNRRIASGCLSNLKWSRHSDRVDVVCGDAASPPLRGVFQGVVTDPPYGRSTKLSERDLKKLYLKAFSEAASLLGKGCRVVTAVPEQRLNPEVLEEVGLRLLERHPLRIHSSLTRVVCVYGVKA